MLSVSPQTLKILAAFVWHIGGLVRLLKARSLLLEADSIHGTKIWPWLAVSTAVILSSLKARYLFVKSCRKNMARIGDGLRIVQQLDGSRKDAKGKNLASLRLCARNWLKRRLSPEASLGYLFQGVVVTLTR